MKIICEVCGRQAIKGYVSGTDPYRTMLDGAVAVIKPGMCICGHCAKDLDENGLFPEERAQCGVE